LVLKQNNSIDEVYEVIPKEVIPKEFNNAFIFDLCTIIYYKRYNILYLILYLPFEGIFTWTRNVVDRILKDSVEESAGVLQADGHQLCESDQCTGQSVVSVV
jgi:hypothetical protein